MLPEPLSTATVLAPRAVLAPTQPQTRPLIEAPVTESFELEMSELAVEFATTLA
jgi:hypothetical protein